MMLVSESDMDLQTLFKGLGADAPRLDVVDITLDRSLRKIPGTPSRSILTICMGVARASSLT